MKLFKIMDELGYLYAYTNILTYMTILNTKQRKLCKIILLLQRTTLYLFIQSFLLRVGITSAILSHLFSALAGYVFSPCSNNFCSSAVQGAGLVPVSEINCSAIAEKI